MDRVKISERLPRSNLADILTPLVTMSRKCLRLAYAQRDFDQLWADFEKLQRHLSAQGTLN